MSHDTIAHILGSIRKARELFRLSDRECDILDRLNNGRSQKEIAEELNLTPFQVGYAAKRARTIFASNISQWLGAKIDARHPIDYANMNARAQHVLYSLNNRPVYWEDVAFAAYEIMSRRNCGPKTYDELKAAVLEHCGNSYYMPSYENPRR